MSDIMNSVHRLIFERTLNLFDWWCISLISVLAAEYSAWFWLMIIPCIYISITQHKKL